MSMPIQRQSESFGYFDDGPRFARDRQSIDLPRGLAGLVNSMGPRITAGLLNTRQAGVEEFLDPHADDWKQEEEEDYSHLPEGLRELIGPPYEEDHRHGSRLAVNTDGMDPNDHAYYQESYGGPYDAGGQWVGDEDGYRAPQRNWNPDYGYEPTDEDERNHEGVMEDDDSGYNWGPEPHPEDEYGPGPSPEFSDGHPLPFGTPTYNPRSSHYDTHTGSRHPFERAATRRLAEHDDLPPLPDDFHVPDSPEGQPDRSPGWLHRQFVGPHKGVWDIPEHELDDRWNKVYDTLGFDPKTRQQWENSRHTDNPSDKWDAGMDGMLGGGVKDYLTRAPMSKDEYARHREDSQNRAKGIADGLWNALYPPEEEEGRRATQNMDTVNSLLASGWQPEHIKYDEDDEPYALYQHPSGWNVKDSGGMYKELGHAATPDEAHDVINVSRYDHDSGESHNDLFGPSDAHNFIEEQLHGDPEETGGTLQYLTQNDPRIRRYKPRQAARLAKDGKCTCWNGYERVPGTKPCAEGSCRKCDNHRKKESMRLAGDGIDWSRVRPGPLVDVPIRKQDPEDYFGWIEDDTPSCPTCGHHPMHVSGPGCRHAAAHGPVPWEQTDEGWHNPGTNIQVLPSEETPGNWQMWAPAVVRKGQNPFAKLHDSHPDPQVLMDWHDYGQGGPAPDWHERPRRIRDNMFPPDQLGPKVGFAPAPPVPGAHAYQPAHRVGLPWRDRVIPGTVIGLDGPHVAIRWDDGQYSNEEPHNIRLL